MIIRVALILGLTLALFYSFSQRQKSRLIAWTIGAVALAGIYFVLFPNQTSTIATLVGVGRGADLVVYCWLVISLIVSVNLQFKILALREQVTEIARELALQSPHIPVENDALANR